MHFHLVGCFRFGAFAPGEDFILQSGGEGQHPFAFAVLGQEGFADGLVLFGEFVGLCALFLFEFGEICLNLGFGFVILGFEA